MRACNTKKDKKQKENLARIYFRVFQSMDSFIDLMIARNDKYLVLKKEIHPHISMLVLRSRLKAQHFQSVEMI